MFVCTYNLSTSADILRGTCVRPLCEQSTVNPLHVHTRGQRDSLIELKLPPGICIPTDAPPKGSADIRNNMSDDISTTNPNNIRENGHSECDLIQS